MVVLRAARLFDGERLHHDATVAIEGGRFVPVPPVSPVEDLGDVTLLPGLVDTHQHLVFNGVGTLEEQVVNMTDEELTQRARGNAMRALAAGVTTIRDLGDRNFVTLALRSDPTLPTILAAGPPLTATGGHCWYLNGECADADALVAAVNERKERDCDVVKVMVTGGALTPSFPMWASQFDLATLQRVVAAAHAVGLPVAAHCHGTGGIRDAVTAGVDTIEHCSFFTDSGGSEPDQATIDALVASPVIVSASLGTDPGFTPPPIIADNLHKMFEAFARYVGAGGALVVGTDAGIAPGKPHDILPVAAQELCRIGLTPRQALTVMTTNAAAACGVGDRKGRVAPGYDADLVAVAGNPTVDPAALVDVRAVWCRGTPVTLPA